MFRGGRQLGRRPQARVGGPLSKLLALLLEGLLALLAPPLVLEPPLHHLLHFLPLGLLGPLLCEVPALSAADAASVGVTLARVDGTALASGCAVQGLEASGYQVTVNVPGVPDCDAAEYKVQLPGSTVVANPAPLR